MAFKIGDAFNSSIEPPKKLRDYDLLRPEALATAAASGFGSPIAKLPISWRLLTALIGGMLAAFVAFLLAGTYTRTETVSGIVSSFAGEVRIAPPAAGIIDAVLVTDGQAVHAGQTLVVIDTPHNGVSGQPLDKSVLDNLDQALVNLRHRLRSLDEATLIERRGIPARLAAAQGERAAMAKQERSSVRRLSLAKDALARLQPVAAKGFISGEAMRRHREEVLELEQAIADAQGAEARLDGQINDLTNLAERQPMLAAQQRGELLDLIARTQREQSVAAGQRGFAVTSPSNGIVTTVQAARGQPIDPQATLMTISKPASPVLAEIFVPSRAIGFLELGQQVRLRYDAFPYQRFGFGTGRVKTISSTVLRPEQIVATIRVQEPVYRAIVALDRDSITAYGRRYRIRPGFAFSADVVLDRRSFAQWLLDPIEALRDRL